MIETLFLIAQHSIAQHALVHGCLACTSGGNSVAPDLGLAGGAAGVLGGVGALATFGGSGGDPGGLDGGLPPGGVGDTPDDGITTDGSPVTGPGEPVTAPVTDGRVSTPSEDAATPDAGPDSGPEADPDSGHDAGPPNPQQPASAAQISEWIGEATAVLLDTGAYSAAQLNPAAIQIIIQSESGGIPGAVNNWDINAVNGIPSQGLMQTTPPTFNQWALPGYNDNITDPVSNIIAGVRYAIARYGSLDNVPGVVAVRAGGGYVGY